MPDAEFPSSRKGRILVADDEPHIRRILGTFLEVGGYEVDQAADGTEALETLSGSKPYQIALLDIMMPGLSGLEVLKAVRLLPHRETLPIVILTAKGQDADKNLALSLGATDFVTKPFSPKKLLVRIDQILAES